MNIKVGENLDVKSEAFLQSVYEAGGTANTEEIRDRTGLTQKERNYRFEKLSELGYISVGMARSGEGRRNAPKTATLTDSGENVVEDGISKDANEWIMESEVTKQVERLEQKVEMLEAQSSRTHNRLKSLENFRDRLANLIFDYDEE